MSTSTQDRPLPPCIARLIQSPRGLEGGEVLVSYLSSYEHDQKRVLELILEYSKKAGFNVEEISKMVQMLENAPAFSCSLVQKSPFGDELCDDDAKAVCPFHSDSIVTRILSMTKAVKIYKNRYIVVHIGDKVFEADLGKILTNKGVNLKEFKVWWASQFNEIINFLKTKDVDEAADLLQAWFQMAEHVDVPDDRDEARNFIVDLIATYQLRPKEMAMGERIVFFDSKYVYIPTPVIKSFAEYYGLDLSLKKLRVLLDDGVATNVQVWKFGNKSVRVWVFIRKWVERELERAGLKFEELIIAPELEFGELEELKSMAGADGHVELENSENIRASRHW